MFVLISILFIQKFIVCWSQFPDHVDLQKIGEVTFDNEKYNVLRPSTHKIVDHFQDTILKRERKDFPTRRVFIDKNGFRHYWSGFETAVSRKTSFVANNQVKNKTNELNKETNGKANHTLRDRDKYKVTSKPKKVLPKRKKRDPPYGPVRSPDNNFVLRQGETGGTGKTLVKTSFFCPFFGVITMTSIID